MDRNTLFIASKTVDPSFNLAAEEVFLRNHDENIIFIYINKPSIIVGKHQNTLSEINADYLEKNNIPVFRRLSGGGTVYHDKGNVNYCIIESGEPGKLVDFVRATTPIVEALEVTVSMPAMENGMIYLPDIKKYLAMHVMFTNQEQCIMEHFFSMPI